MKKFAELFCELEDAPQPKAQQRAIRAWLAAVEPAEAAWGLHLLLGGKRTAVVKPAQLAEWAREASGLTEALFERCRDETGDPCEAAALVLPAPTSSHAEPLDVWLSRSPLCCDVPEQVRKQAVRDAWARMETAERFVFNRLLVGWSAPPAARGVVVRAVAEHAGLSPAVVEHRLAGAWTPSHDFYRAFTAPDAADADPSRPYPFRSTAPLSEPPQSLGDAALWQAERRCDGLRVQLVRRQGRTYLWSRSGDLVTERFPELADLPLPDGTALDGELLAWDGEAPMPPAALARRLECKLLDPVRTAKKKSEQNAWASSAPENLRRPPPKLLREVPVRLVAFDLLEEAGEDVRALPLAKRRRRLETLLGGVGGALAASTLLEAADWAEWDRLRNLRPPHGAGGIVLKLREAPYDVDGPPPASPNAWRAWKPDPHRVEAVLTYVQRGTDGRSAEFTFGLWRGVELVTFAVAPNDLPEDEAAELEQIVRRTIKEKFGPVAGLQAECVFEVAFDRIEPAPRRKSGAAVSGVRAVRWLKEKRPEEAARLETLHALLSPPNAGSPG